ncbi:MAG: hypothetical protein Q9162_006578 [Coniocarpon cinnabarinum]
MFATSIPKHYTASPSSFSGTPHLTINRDAAVDVDSSNAFEGPEKLLEVWFAPSGASLPPPACPSGLKSVPASAWTEMLDMVHCKVLSVIESDEVDAYLLSESSMFVYPHKLVLKTCGTTTLLLGIPKVLEIAALCAGFPHSPACHQKNLSAAAATHQVFYSRKNFLYPQQQRGPHRSWRDEVRALDGIFRRGSAYMIGKMNGEHWYLYITEPMKELTPPLTPEEEKYHAETETKMLEVPNGGAAPLMNALKGEIQPQDETLEILMTDLDEDNAKQFYLDSASAVAESKYFEDLSKARQESADALGDLDDSEDKPIVTDVDDIDGVDDVFTPTHDRGGANSSVPEELSTEGHALGSVVSDTCGLADVYPKHFYPDARIDAYLFNPCGFSANGVIPAPSPATGTSAASSNPQPATKQISTHYFTVHVTPEPQCSYASFETNVPSNQSGRQTAEIVEQVVNIFKPGRFSVTLFEAKPEREVRPAERKVQQMDVIKGYRRVDRVVHDLDGYDLIFRHFERYDWQGGAPRLGEAF